MQKAIREIFYKCVDSRAEELTRKQAEKEFGKEAVALCLKHNERIKAQRLSSTRTSVLWRCNACDDSLLLVESVYEKASGNDNFSRRCGYEEE